MFGRRNTGDAAGRTPPPGILAPEKIARAMLSAFKEAHTHQTGAGIHYETLLSGLGAMAGFGCQMAARFVLQRIDPAKRTGTELAEIKTKDGGLYYFGDFINQPLLEARPTSVYSLIAGAAHHLGAPVPDPAEIVRFVTGSLGTEQFGTIRVGPEHQPAEAPLRTLQRQWAAGERMMDTMHAEPMARGWHYALAAQFAIVEGKDILAPEIGAQIALESAFAMSKVDPRVVGGVQV